MSSASVTHDFSNGTVGDADQVDQNFTDLVNFLNSHVVHKGETALEAKSGSPANKFQVGLKTITTVAGSPTASATLTFPAAFATIPYVFCTFESSTNQVVRVSNRTTTTCLITIAKRDGTNYGGGDEDVMWWAVGT